MTYPDWDGCREALRILGDTIVKSYKTEEKWNFSYDRGEKRARKLASVFIYVETELGVYPMPARLTSLKERGSGKP